MPDHRLAALEPAALPGTRRSQEGGPEYTAAIFHACATEKSVDAHALRSSAGIIHRRNR